jgi:hypothetical protein
MQFTKTFVSNALLTRSVPVFHTFYFQDSRDFRNQGNPAISIIAQHLLPYGTSAMSLLPGYRAQFSQSHKVRTNAVTEREQKRRIAVAQRPPVCKDIVLLPSLSGADTRKIGAFDEDKLYVVGDNKKGLRIGGYTPFITFARAGDPTAYPRMYLPYCRYILGVKAYASERRIVVASLQLDSDNDKEMVKIYVYTVAEDFTCALHCQYTFDELEDYGGSGFEGKLLRSPVSAGPVILLGNLARQSRMLLVRGTNEGGHPMMRLERKWSPACMFLDDLHFKPDGSYYIATAHVLSENMVSLQVEADNERIAVFERVVVLPPEIGALPQQEEVSCACHSYRRVYTASGMVERLLVQVTTYCTEAKQRDVLLLLNMPTNEVIQMCVLENPFSNYALSADAASILHVQCP